jgi:hypothetical protein
MITSSEAVGTVPVDQVAPVPQLPDPVEVIVAAKLLAEATRNNKRNIPRNIPFAVLAASCPSIFLPTILKNLTIPENSYNGQSNRIFFYIEVRWTSYLLLTQN